MPNEIRPIGELLDRPGRRGVRHAVTVGCSIKPPLALAEAASPSDHASRVVVAPYPINLPEAWLTACAIAPAGEEW